MSTPTTSIPRSEHPRPDFMRDTYAPLNGAWQFAFDDADTGLSAGWHMPGHTLPMTITVPFCYQSEMSGIGGDEIHPIIWYRRAFTVPGEMRNKHVLLRFGAVDFACQVYVNGRCVGGHKGGYTPFAIDVTAALVDGENDLCLRVEDAPDCTQPRGKQYWERGLMGCWYTPTSGIWQSVYLEGVEKTYLERIHITPDIDRAQATVSVTLNHIPAGPLRMALDLSYDGMPVRSFTMDFTGREARFPIDMETFGTIDGLRVWSPENPNLYDLSVRLLDGDKPLDHVSTYFGMRKIELRDGHVRLNNRKLYQRLVLDQGYWPESLLTPPSDDAIRADIEWTLKFGYNGARKHQKIEDPRYYYWADKLGLLIWGELPSTYLFNADSIANLSSTMLEFIDRDFNHPSIIAWTPTNESWGVSRVQTDPRQQALCRTLYHLCKAADGTRLVSGNDGWEQTTTDICALHDYTAAGEDLAIRFASREAVEANGCDTRLCWADGEQPTGKEAFLVTEYGGIAFDNIGVQGEMGGMATWGYNGKVESEEAFIQRFDSATSALRDIPYCHGYCYTQLTDVQQEINGLLTPDRKPKVAPEKIASLNGNPKAW